MAYELRSNRPMTSYGLDAYLDMCERHLYKIRDCQRNMDSIIMDVDQYSTLTLGDASRHRTNLRKFLRDYQLLCDDYIRFLDGQRTAESELDRANFLPTCNDVKSKEAELLQREAILKAERQVLSLQKEVAEAESGVKAVKRVLDFDNLNETYVPNENVRETTQSVNHQEKQKAETVEQSDHRTAEYVRDQQKQKESISNNNTSDCDSTSKSRSVLGNVNTYGHLNPNASPYTPRQIDSSKEQVHEIAQFMIKKDLLTSRLSHFDDKASSYRQWKVSFSQIMTELSATPLEQLDLLNKYLGPNSKFQATNIRAANANYPATAVRLIWERLDCRYGSPEALESSIHFRVKNFPKLSNHQRKELYDLADLASEIEAIKQEGDCGATLGYFDSSLGVNRLACKLPYSLQERWTNTAHSYKSRYEVLYPPFSVFVNFLHETAKLKNDPGFVYDSQQPQETKPKLPKEFGFKSKSQVSAFKTTFTPKPTEEDTPQHLLCPLHGTRHLLNDCRGFLVKPISERIEFIKKNGYCFKCCGPKKHLANKCRETVECKICSSKEHPSALHGKKNPTSTPQKHHEGEVPSDHVDSKCTQVCETGPNVVTSKSCAKILLVKVYHKNEPDRSKLVYCLIDDQSNRSLVSSEFFNFFRENSPESEYVLSSCAGQFVTSGRKASGYVVTALDNQCSIDLSELIECNEIPNNRNEIPSPAVASSFEHLKDLSSLVPEINKDAQIELLIGRDTIRAHHVLDQRVGPDGAPYAQKLPLGWVIIGNVCLGYCGSFHNDVVTVNKTVILQNGRPSYFAPCENNLLVSDPVFQKTPTDETPGPSIEDKEFLEIMDTEFKKTPQGQWQAPLPFKKDRVRLENNRSTAEQRARSFDTNLKHNPEKRAHVLEFMQKLLDSGHAEKAKQLSSEIECWYLPMFAVYHPKKPDSVRVVFDSSSKHHGLSLNDVMLKGPDMYNSLLGILLRFRKEAYAITVDIEQMFHNFKVIDDHRRFLRFLWHEENNFNKPLTEFQMSVHVFGNSPSPAVATYGLRKTVELADSDVKNFITDNFYVDDGLTSCVSEETAIALVQETKRVLHEQGRLRLHKVASNSRAVLEAFESNDLAKNLKNLDLGSSSLPVQRSLGLLWDTERDKFAFSVSSDFKPYTRRGVLSTINSLYDPIGFLSPVLIRGKLLMREMLSTSENDWDKPLPEHLQKPWNQWVTSLKELEDLQIPRQYCVTSFNESLKREVHIFADASKDAIGAVAYLKLYDVRSSHVSFVLGKAKVAPQHGHTIPRLELCAAVLAAELCDILREQLSIDSKDFYFYTDSRVVLGYLCNESRRFYVYVGNRVSRIRSSSTPSQWSHVSSNNNPADLATRSINSSELQDSLWIRGPDLLRTGTIETPSSHTYSLIDPEEDANIRPTVTCSKTGVVSSREISLGSKRFEQYSQWTRLVKSIEALKNLIRNKLESKDSSQISLTAEQVIVRAVQQDLFPDEITALKSGKCVSKTSSLAALSPILDSDSILRVGGRLKHAPLSENVDMANHPIILPKRHHVSLLIIRHFHQLTRHSGRHLTEGAIRRGGYWIIGAKRSISSLISQCVICRKLRGKTEWQTMADLPIDRLTPCPPFSYVGVDTFGPWLVNVRKTRGGAANQKRWALLFTCLTIRAVHIEVIEELSTSSFISALRRVIAVRGPIAQFRSDRGTNFVGATSELCIDSEFIEKGPVRKFLQDSNIVWKFNAPYAHHMGGPWERLIGIARRILEGIFSENRGKTLTHEILVTFMAEVMAIINNRPLSPVSSDPECPSILSPATLLTMKTSADVKPFPPFGLKDMLRSHWKCVQGLAEEFWQRWKNEYLSELQSRSKWRGYHRNVSIGDIVLMKDQDAPRNLWPTGTIDNVFPSSDGKIRKVEVSIVKDGRRISYTRPISELVTYLEVDAY